MHDPDTVAHNIYWPLSRLRSKWENRKWEQMEPEERKQKQDQLKEEWKRRRAKTPPDKPCYMRSYPRFPNSMFTIWHHDPETDGSDDSCGYSFVKIPGKLWEKLKREVKFYRDHDFYIKKKVEDLPPERQEYYGLQYQDFYYEVNKFYTPFALLYGVWGIMLWHLYRKRDIPEKDMATILSLVSNGVDNIEHHYNSLHNEEESFTLWKIALRCHLTNKRPWYRHPRWHIYHWHIQWHFWQKLRRWLFDRCTKCGKRFAWGDSNVVSRGSWDPPKPKMFKSNDHIYHGRCEGSGGAKMAEAVEVKEETSTGAEKNE